jgi:hypothetical protein
VQAHKLRPDIDDTFADYGLKLDIPQTAAASAAAH